jgi:hypothetical protein
VACVAHPFGSLATRVGPMDLRPRLATGLPFSRMKRQFCTDLFRREKCSFSSHSRGHPPKCFDTTVGRMDNAVKFGQGISPFVLRLAFSFCAKRGPAFSPGGAADNNLANGSAVGGESTTAAAGVGVRRAAQCVDAVGRVEEGAQLLAWTADFTPWGGPPQGGVPRPVLPQARAALAQPGIRPRGAAQPEPVVQLVGADAGHRRKS